MPSEAMISDYLEVFWRENETSISPGVFGVVYEDMMGSIIVNWIRAKKEGSGAVGRYLDSLPTDRHIQFIAVTSDRLKGMLERRGFRETLIDFRGELMPIHVRNRKRS